MTRQELEQFIARETKALVELQRGMPKQIEREAVAIVSSSGAP